MIAGVNDPVAEELLRQAVAEDPEFASAYIHLAHAIHNQNKPKAEFLLPAEKAFRMSDTTSDRERYFIRGSYYDFLGDDAKAITAYETLLTLYPDHYWGLNNLTDHHHKSGRNRDAAELSARAADMRPKDFAVQCRSGLRYGAFGSESIPDLRSPGPGTGYPCRSGRVSWRASPGSSSCRPRSIGWPAKSRKRCEHGCGGREDRLPGRESPGGLRR